jgi:hypothetical protein
MFEYAPRWTSATEAISNFIYLFEEPLLKISFHRSTQRKLRKSQNTAALAHRTQPRPCSSKYVDI